MKKIISIIVIAALLMASSVSVAAAASPDSVSLENAIKRVKAVIDIPADASVFDYYSWEDPGNGKIWSLSWNDENYEKSYNVTVNENGTITGFSSYESSESTGLGAFTRDQGQKSAEAFLMKVLPADMRDFRLSDSYSNDMSFNYSFNCYVNGFPVNNMMFSVAVDKITGKVTQYYGYDFIKGNDYFPVLAEKISKDKAKEAYMGDLGISLVYNSYYDYAKRELTVFPAYVVNADKYIDAESGAVVSGYAGNMPYAAARDTAMAAGGADNGAALTPEEQEVVDALSGMISKDEAVKSAVSKVPGLSSSAKPDSANLNAAYGEKDKYIWYLYFTDYSVSINAKDGSLISFNYNGNINAKPVSVSEENAGKTALDFIKKAAADKVGDIVFSKDMSGDYNFVYIRNVDGTYFPGNNISVSVDPSNGRLISYNLLWYDSVEFPEISNAMPIEKAFDIYDQESKFDLMYSRTDKDSISLVYGFDQAPPYSIDPVSGGKLGYDGKPYKGADAVASYGDVSGKWYEYAVNALLDNGYYLEGGSFNGGAMITQEEFFRYLYSPVQASYSQDDFYAMLIQSKVMTKDEKAPGDLLTRQDAAKFAIRYIGLDKAAGDASIFKNPYKDAVSADYLGYAALAKSLSIMRGDANGSFNGAATLSRAQAAVVIYNLLNNKY